MGTEYIKSNFVNHLYKSLQPLFTSSSALLETRFYFSSFFFLLSRSLLSLYENWVGTDFYECVTLWRTTIQVEDDDDDDDTRHRWFQIKMRREKTISNTLTGPQGILKYS